MVIGFLGIFIFYLIYENLKLKRVAAQGENSPSQSKEIEKYRKEIELNQISNFFSSQMVANSDQNQLLWEICKGLISRFDFDDSMIYLWNADESMLVQVAGYGNKGDMTILDNQELYHLPRGKGLIGKCAENGEAIIINDTSKNPDYIHVDEITSFSEICVPIIYENQVLGVLNAESPKKNYFTSWHLELLKIIANNIALKLNSIKKGNELAQAEKYAQETEINFLRAQMNPHFIFNSLQSIHNYIWDNSLESASEYLVQFSKLIRNTLEYSNEKYITLSEEIHHLELYVALEHRRLANKFNYRISYNDVDLENKIIPLLYQPFVENAIWHGIRHLEHRIGFLEIIFTQQKSTITCEIIDNGIGREASRDLKRTDKKSLGVSLTERRLMQETQSSNLITIMDLEEGTKVIIKYPVS
jgi:putative methionine-R-sulfoxide reductase with GAF domain